MNSQAINKIGEELCQCRDNCKGIRRNQEKGDFPRGLIFEPGESDSGLGTLVCGLNPGTASDEEKQFFLEHDGNYSAQTEFWKSTPGNLYFKRPRKFVRDLGRIGPILWTDLVKCENESKEVKLVFRQHPSTFRHCTSKFLSKEINIVPQSWLIICLGCEAYRGITYMFPNRPTLGIPHPTGAFMRYRHFLDNGNLKELFRKQIDGYFSSQPRGTLWIDPAPPRTSKAETT